MLAAPRFHHLHLDSVDPDAAIDFEGEPARPLAERRAREAVPHDPLAETRAFMIEGPSRGTIDLVEVR